MSDAVQSIKVTVHYFSGQGRVGGGERFMELEHFDKDFVRNTRKKEAPQGNTFDFTVLDTLKNKL